MAQTAAERIRAQRKEATRRALLEAGLAETIERRGEIPSIEAACARAGYTRGAFYVHFKDRDQYVGEMLEWVLNDILARLFVEAAADDAALHEVIKRFTEALGLGEWPDLQNNIAVGYLAILRELTPGSAVRERHSALMRGIIAQLAERIRSGQASGRLRADIDADSTALVVLLVGIAAIMWSDLDLIGDADALGRSLIALLEVPA